MNKNLFNSLKTLTKRQVGGELPSELLVGNKTITDEVKILEELSKSFFPDQRKIGRVQEEIINNCLNQKSKKIECRPQSQKKNYSMPSSL